MKTRVIDPTASPTEFDAAIVQGLAEFEGLPCGATERALRIGVANAHGAIYREIVASSAHEWVAVTALMMSLGLVDELHDSGDAAYGYDAIFKGRHPD